MRKYEYFYDSNKVLTHIDDAFRPNIYTSVEGVEFIVRHGEKNIKHYAVKERVSALSYGFDGGGESPEHYNAKMKIVKELKYYDSILKQEVHFAKVVPEKKIVVSPPGNVVWVCCHGQALKMATLRTQDQGCRKYIFGWPQSLKIRNC